MENLHTELCTSEMPVAARKRARGEEYMERQKMKLQDQFSYLVGLLIDARATVAKAATGASGASSAPLFSPGQSILSWYAPWFKKIPEGELPEHYCKKNRPT